VVPRTWWIHGAEGGGPGKVCLDLAVRQLEDAMCLGAFRGKPLGLVCYNMRSAIFSKVFLPCLLMSQFFVLKTFNCYICKLINFINMLF
jgi:hypothetical protein